MERRAKRQRLRHRNGSLFGEPIINPLVHLSAHYPFPARLSEHYLAKLNGSNIGKSYCKGAMLFEEGDKPAGVFVILEGRVKVSVNSAQGKTLTLGFFGSGTILGLAAAILGRNHAANAEALEPTKVIFVTRNEILREMQSDSTAALQAAELVSEACYFILDKMTAVNLSQSADQKLARCLLGLLAHNTSSCGEAPLKLDLSQEAIAQMVGLSRETVTRVFSRFRRRRILDWRRSGVVIRDRRALEIIADLSETAANLGGKTVGETETRPSVTS
jgi:CRP-like cAMP-binding protein